MNKVIAFLSILVMFVSASQPVVGQNSKKKDKVLLKFDRGDVTRGEFERVYAKNNGGLEAVMSHTPEQYREYLDLYVNFKRKVFAAEDQGLNETEAFKREFNQYKKQLVQPYLSAKDVEEQLIQEAYERSKSLVSASHLLIRIEENASPADTLAAYQRLLALRDSVLKDGKSFEEIAGKYSQDPSARNNQGNLGYFSAFSMVYPFESAAYNTEVGDISMPVRTQFGFHILKVNDKIPNEGTKRAAHIIIRIGDRYNAKTQDEAKEIINEIYGRLQKGEAFSDLASQFSDDPNTASKGGDLGTGRLLPIMEEIKMKLGEGEFSEPFETPYGFHIMSITDVQELKGFEESKPQLKQRISRDSRSQISRKVLLQRIKEENNFTEDMQWVDSLKEKVDVKFTRGGWTPDSTLNPLLDKTIITLGDDYQATIQDMLDYYSEKRLRYPRLSPSEAVNQVYNTFLEEKLLAYEEERLPEKNEDFRNLLQEYRDGILLFTLMEQKVWKKAVEDSTGLLEYYENNKDQFQAKQRLDVREYRSSSEEVLKEVKKMIESGQSDGEIDSVMNSDSPLTVRMTSQTYEKGQAGIPDELFDQEAGAISSVINRDNFYRLFVSEGTRPAGVKSFEEAKSECITQYQDYLEKTWLEELAETYPVKINEKVFKKLFK